MKISSLLKTIVVLSVINVYSIFAADGSVPDSLPQVSAESSKYVRFNATDLTVSDRAIIFNGKFIILGEGVYGHFDFVALNDSGVVIRKLKSDDRAWRRDQVLKVKSINMNLGAAHGCTEVKVSFHEMRIDTDTGACVSE